MKTINNIFKAFSVAILLSMSSANADAQTTKSKVTTFMTANGWTLDSLNKPISDVEADPAVKGYYKFKKEYKYTVVAFSENPEVKRVKLNLTDVKGNLFQKNYNTHIIRQLFSLPFECAVHMFSYDEDLTLSIEALNKVCVSKCGIDSEYLIFSRTY